MVELRSSTGALNFALVTPEIISSLGEKEQQALLNLMKANEVKEAAVARKNAAVKRAFDAIADEAVKHQAHADASSPIPFSTADAEKAIGRPLNAAETREARQKHGARVRALLEQQARRAAVAAYVPNR